MVDDKNLNSREEIAEKTKNFIIIHPGDSSKGFLLLALLL
jgi:hypothetical protein